MNEKIKQLVDKTAEMIPGVYTLKYEDGGEGTEFNEASLEKFAELIVRECSRVIVNGGYWSGGPIGPKRQCTPPEIAQMIKEHFGVEE